MVFDMGAGSTKRDDADGSRAARSRTSASSTRRSSEVQVLGSGWDRTLGGDALNYAHRATIWSSQFVDSPKAKAASVSPRRRPSPTAAPLPS